MKRLNKNPVVLTDDAEAVDQLMGIYRHCEDFWDKTDFFKGMPNVTFLVADLPNGELARSYLGLCPDDYNLIVVDRQTLKASVSAKTMEIIAHECIHLKLKKGLHGNEFITWVKILGLKVSDHVEGS